MLKLWRFIVDVLLNRKIARTPSDHLTGFIAAACLWDVVRTRLVTYRIRSMEEDNVLTGVCHSVHTRGGGGFCLVEGVGLP